VATEKVVAGAAAEALAEAMEEAMAATVKAGAGEEDRVVVARGEGRVGAGMAAEAMEC
jgi:hypothetical protein